MQDDHLNFYALSQHEVAGVDFRIHLARAAPEFLIVAPHGGGIERGTSEIAVACMALLDQSDPVVTIHGETTEEPEAVTPGAACRARRVLARRVARWC